MNIFSYNGISPTMEQSCFIAPGAMLIGNITIGEYSSIWYNAVVRGDVNKVFIGDYTNIQDCCVVHCDSGVSGINVVDGLPTIIGNYVTVGHRSILHACTIENYCLIGMGSVILDGAIIGEGSVIGASTLITKGTIIPPFSLVIGSPGKVVRTLGSDTIAARKIQALEYLRLAQGNKSGVLNG